MSLSSCFARPPLSLQVDLSKKRVKSFHNDRTGQRLTLSPRSGTADFLGGWSFVGGSKLVVRPEGERFNLSQKSSGIKASWMSSSQIASSVFGIGTVAVLPFYALMVLAPKSELTKRSMQSSIPYVVLGVLYTYLLYLSWTPETIRLIFSNKYLLPELTSIAKMFSSEMTLASAWIHLLVVDLFAARQVFHDGEVNQVETRHSVSLCLLFCPVGILTHCVTKALTRPASAKTLDMH